MININFSQRDLKKAKVAFILQQKPQTRAASAASEDYQEV